MRTPMPLQGRSRHSAASMLPITALAHLELKSLHVLLAGHGNQIEAYNSSTGELICQTICFKGQAIHGIAVISTNAHHDTLTGDMVLYGRDHVAWASLRILTEKGKLIFSSFTISTVLTISDWILCCRKSITSNSSGVFMTSYNALFDIKYNQSLAIVEYSSICDTISTFLYSADFVQLDEGSFLVASGTAFGELLVWLCVFDERLNKWNALPWREYRGHKGSIFGVSISPVIDVEGKLRRVIATSSDDRTIHIWDASDVEAEATRCSEKLINDRTPPSAKFSRYNEDLAMTWAHSSRIWNVDFADGLTSVDLYQWAILSTGEDGQAQSWSLDPRKLFSHLVVGSKALINEQTDRYHAGKNIWARHVTRIGTDYKLFTGGADAQLVARSYNSSGKSSCPRLVIAQPFSPKQLKRLDQNMVAAKVSPQGLKRYLLVGPGEIVATTDSGTLFKGSVADREILWKILMQNDVRNPLVIASQTFGPYAFLVNSSHSRLIAMDHTSGASHVMCDLRAYKVASVFVAWSSTILDGTDYSAKSCVAVSYHDILEIDLVWTDYESVGPKQTSKTQALLPATFDVTAVCFDPNTQTLLCGSRSGAVAAYTLDQSSGIVANPHACRRHIHGEDKVTSIRCLDQTAWKSSDSSYFVTTGRDGCYCVIKFETGQCVLNLVHQASPPFGPQVEGAQLVDPSSGMPRLIIYGFRSKDFVAWDETEQTQLMAVDCGGAHRNWDFRLNTPDGQGGTFAWTKAGTLLFLEQPCTDHQIIKQGGHGREIKALAMHELGASKWLIATGSEDTDIRLFEYSLDPPCLRNVSVIRKHNTGLQHLQFSLDGTILVSAGGMEEMCVWHISPIPVLGRGVVFAGSLPRLGAQSDARIMSFDITNSNPSGNDRSLQIVAAFSNGKVEAIHYTPSSNFESGTFTVLSQIDLGSVCLTQAHILSSEAPRDLHPSLQARIGATNGFITAAAFPLDSNSTSSLLHQTTKAQHKVHQNSITNLQTVHLTKSHRLIVTSGDDCALALTLEYTPHWALSAGPHYKSLLIPKAHAAAVTALAAVELAAIYHGQKQLAVVTAGNDQRVRTWHICVDVAELEQLEASAQLQEETGPANYGDGLNTVQVRSVEEQYTNVADVSAIEVFPADLRSLKARVLVVGVGMEILELELPRSNAFDE